MEHDGTCTIKNPASWPFSRFCSDSLTLAEQAGDGHQ
jgi:hypothetical protein